MSWAELFLVPAYVADMEVGRGLNSVRIIAFVLGWGMSPFPSANVGEWVLIHYQMIISFWFLILDRRQSQSSSKQPR